MRYLSMYGTEGFRSFLGILNGKSAYAPEKIPPIDPDILLERDYSVRLQAVVGSYCDNHLKLSRDVLSVISSNIGSLQSVSARYSLWCPKNHLSLLGELLLAGLFETFLPEELQKQLYFISKDNDGIAFKEAFSLEKKSILLSNQGNPSIPLKDENTKVFMLDNNKIKQELINQQKVFFDSKNIFRIVGHMATIIEALYKTEEVRQRFYNDLVSLVIPADNAEFILAAYYLSKSKLPIKNIYAVSTEHRMMHNFLDKGEFKITDVSAYENFSISLDRILFEASRGSVEKVVFWKQELAKHGSFKIDSKSLSSIQNKFKAVFVTNSFCNTILQDFPLQTNIKHSKISLYAYHISQEASEHILAFDSLNPELEMPTEISYPTFNSNDII